MLLGHRLGIEDVDGVRAGVVSNLMIEDTEVALAQSVLVSIASHKRLCLGRGDIYNLGHWEPFLD